MNIETQMNILIQYYFPIQIKNIINKDNINRESIQKYQMSKEREKYCYFIINNDDISESPDHKEL